jgi:hypothetical protein
MSNRPCTLRIASLHGKSQLVKWNVLAQGKSRTECHRRIDAVVSEIVADDPLDSLLAQERARERFQIIREGWYAR